MERLGLEFRALQEVAEISTEGVIIYSLADEKVIYTNTAATRMLGIRKNATQSDIENVLKSITPADREYVKNQYLTVAKKAVTAEVEFRVDTGREDLYVCCNAYVVANGTAIVTYIKDITQPRHHEDYLVEFGARKNTVLDTLMHQMSGALNLMRHLSSQAAKYIISTNDKQLSAYLTLLNENNSRCLDIIENLLIEEHQKSPYVAVKNTKFNIIERVSFIHGELRQSYGDRTFVFEHTTDIIYITSDTVKLLQVVNNLASNAIKFSPAKAPIVIRVTENADHVIFSITDFGIGIPVQAHSLIFERQSGFGRTGLNGEKSIGLGLFISKHLINLLKGKIWFESKEGQGSTFFFSLPKS